ncbi:MAG: cation acetate symporter [Planctomycetes bacterium]|nr:cation acetate symporter [Planctomycetota bacterium]
MIYEASLTAILVFASFVTVVLTLSFYLGRKAKSAKGYYAAHGGVHWFVNGVAFAGDYLSAASFLGICGMIAFYGYDGFLYSIGYLAGWVVALFVIAEPIKRLGRFTFADALDSRFNSRGIKLAAAVSTLVVSIFYLIPQMVGAGVLIKPLLGFSHRTGVLFVGVIVTLIVTTAGMVSTTWVQFIKGSMLVVFCAILTVAILAQGLTTQPMIAGKPVKLFRVAPAGEIIAVGDRLLDADGAWKDKPYVRRERIDGAGASSVEVWRKMDAAGTTLVETQVLTVKTQPDGSVAKFINGVPQGHGKGEADLLPVGNVYRLAGGKTETGPVGPFAYFREFQGAQVVTWGSEKIEETINTPGEPGPTKAETTIYFPTIAYGRDLLIPGSSPTFSKVRLKWPAPITSTNPAAVAAYEKAKTAYIYGKLDFISLMLALFCGTASLPHILIRYYTVKNQADARKSTVVGIASIGFFYILTLYLGLGAMTRGTLDVTNNNMSAPLLAKSFGELPFAIISAIAFTTVLGTVSGLIMAASGAVAHDIMENVLKRQWDDHAKVRAGKMAAIVVGVIAMALGIAFEKLNVSFLVGWAFNIAASANLPAIIMLLFWKGTTKQGITASIIVGMTTSLAWVLLSAEAYKYVYDKPVEDSIVPFSQPGIVTIPLAFAVLVVVSVMTRRKTA